MSNVNPFLQPAHKDKPPRPLRKGEKYIRGVLINKHYNTPEEKIVVRDVATGSLVALDRAQDFKPGIHTMYVPNKLELGTEDEEKSDPVPGAPTTPTDVIPPPALDDISYAKAHYELLKQKGWNKLAGAERESYKGYKEQFGA